MVSAGGESGGAWEVKETKAHLWVALELERRAGDGGSTASGVAPVGFGRGEVAWELREGEAVLARGSERAEERR